MGMLEKRLHLSFSVKTLFRPLTRKKFLLHVGLSNILNSELNRRKPVEGPHGQVVGTAVVKGKLL